MGPRFRDQSGAAYARIVKDYPLSPLVDEAKKKLVAMEDAGFQSPIRWLTRA